MEYILKKETIDFSDRLPIKAQTIVRFLAKGIGRIQLSFFEMGKAVEGAGLVAENSHQGFSV